ncbi:MAG: coniferyl aldehyde dehydrogenase [Pseudomonadota bacterium]|nr:coniferyl aldehyde dehydrogenase [Pseudomonadota bacterium]
MSSPQPTADKTPIRPPKLTEVDNPQNPYLSILENQRQAILNDGFPSVERRVQALNTLAKAVGEYSDQLIKAVQADFGHRSAHETIASEVLGVLGEIKLTKGKIKRWAKPKRPPLFSGMPGGRIIYQPKGVVGIMGAWNYPVMLVLSPLVGVLSAGNHAMIKPPDVTPRTSDVIQDLIAKYFDPSYVTVITGDVQAAIDFSALPFDHLMYTGNTEIGRRVMMAAAKNLTPVTLEMGGKSPVIVTEDYPAEKAVNRLMMGKTINAGQTCIAPDYMLVPKNKEQACLDAFVAAATKRYPTIADNPDITWIVNERHYQRVQALIEDARAKGANVVQVNPANEQIPEGKRVIPMTMITNVSEDMRVMQEEIFGPVLPVKTVNSSQEALQYVKSRPRPLALYYFDEDRSRAKRVMSDVISGGACVNDTVLHLANFNMPFGGSGDSGVGAYHGFWGFQEFSHRKAVQFQSNWFSPSQFLSGPYPAKAYQYMQRAVKWLSK